MKTTRLLNLILSRSNGTLAEWQTQVAAHCRHNSRLISAMSCSFAAPLTIADSGIGIAKEERERVFDRFYRSEKSRHEAGSGLGLSLVKAVFNLHNGTILLKDNHPGLRVQLTL